MLLRLIFTLLTCLLSCPFIFSQQNYERKTYIELQERADFFDVDDRYHFRSDTIFYTRGSFLVDPHYDIHAIDGREYIIISYPPFRKGSDRQIQDFENLSEPNPRSLMQNGVHTPLSGKNGRLLMIEKAKFDQLPKSTLYDIRWHQIRNYKITTGILTVPFKFRPAQDSVNFSLSTDVSLGPYIGITKRFSRRNPFYFTFPATLGLSFININDNTTNLSSSLDQVNVVPGISWSSGMIFQFEHFNIGFVLGQDFASGLGDDWIYHGKTWYSFAIGYNFLKEEDE